jgi:hypothetical protein
MKKYIFIALQLLSCVVLQAQIGICSLNPDPTSVIEFKSTIRGFSSPRLTTAQRNTITSPATGLVIYNSDRNCSEWYDGMVWHNGYGSKESSGGTAVVSGYSCSIASAGTLTAGIVVSGATQTIIATVVTTGTYTITAIANGVTFTGSGTFAGAGVQNIVLTATGVPIVAETSNFLLNRTPNCIFNRIVLAAVGPVGGNAICDGSAPTTVIPIISTTGKVWMDRNLGASRQAISATDYQGYGCLYQWGRGNDGHASIAWTSSTMGTAVNGSTATLSTTDRPGNILFITGSGFPNDWRSSPNNALW